MAQATRAASDTPVLYSLFQSAPDASFWNALSKKKLDEFGLNDDLQSVSASYTNGKWNFVVMFCVNYCAVVGH